MHNVIVLINKDFNAKTQSGIINVYTLLLVYSVGNVLLTYSYVIFIKIQ